MGEQPTKYLFVIDIDFGALAGSFKLIFFRKKAKTHLIAPIITLIFVFLSFFCFSRKVKIKITTRLCCYSDKIK